MQGVRKETDPGGRRRHHQGRQDRLRTPSARPTGSRWWSTATYEVTDYLLVGQRVWHLGFTPDGKYVVSVNGASNDISVIDVADRKVVKSITVGELPWGVAIH